MDFITGVTTEITIKLYIYLVMYLLLLKFCSFYTKRFYTKHSNNIQYCFKHHVHFFKPEILST